MCQPAGICHFCATRIPLYWQLIIEMVSGMLDHTLTNLRIIQKYLSSSIHVRMSKNQQPKNLEDLLDKIEESAKKNDDKVTLDNILDEVGRRSFGPLLLVAGVITLTPIVGDIPGIPSLMGLIVLLTGIQLIFHADHFWLPNWLLKRSVKSGKLNKAIKWLRKPAQFVDRYLKHRLVTFTKGPAVYAVAVTCILIALATPAMELVPFSANGAGAALTAFGLSLIAHDGLLSLIAFFFTVITAGVVIYNLI